MAGKSIEQRMSNAETRIQQLEAQKRQMAEKLKEQERKARTHLLIQIGGTMARLGIDTLEKVQSLQRVVERHPEIQAWLKQVADGSVDHPEEGDPSPESGGE